MTDKPSLRDELDGAEDYDAPVSELPEEQKAQRIVWTDEERAAIQQFMEYFAGQGFGYDG